MTPPISPIASIAKKDATSNTSSRCTSPAISITQKALTESSASFASSGSFHSHITTHTTGAEIASSGIDLTGLGSFFVVKTYDHETHVPTPLEALPKEILEALPFKPSTVTKTRTLWSDQHMTTLAMPTDKAMLATLSYYQLKYGVPIVLAASGKSIKQAILSSSFGDEVTTWGVIVSTGTIDVPHVTPLLVHRDHLWQYHIFDLDSANFTLPHLKILLKGLLEGGLALKLYKVSKPRQADPFSCRTDSLVILKDALVDIALNSPDDLMKFINVDTSLKLDIYSGEFSLPAAWAKTVQVSSALPSDLSLLVNNKHEQSLADFRTRFIQKVSKQETYCVSTTTPDGSEVSREYKLSLKYHVNTYLNYKALRLVKLMKRLTSENDPRIIAIFNALKKAYNP